MKNKPLRKLILFSLAIVIIGFTGILIKEYANAGNLPDPFSRVEVTEPKPVIETLSNDDLNWPNTASQQIQEIVGQWGKLLNGPGWVHMTYRITSEVDNGVIFPDGTKMPLSYNEEDWYFIDAQKLAIKAVKLLKNDAGVIFQEVIINNNTYYNKTFGDTGDAEPFAINIDFGTSNHIMEAETLGIPIQRSYSKINNQDVIEFSYKEGYSQPVSIGNSKELVESFIENTFFNINTNALVRTQTFWNYITGEQVLFEQNDLQILEMVLNPPDEILNMLENIK